MMIRSTYHTVLNASPGAAKLERDMLFDIPFIADWRKIGDYRQRQTDLNNLRKERIDYDYKVGDKILVRKEGILRKTQPRYHNDPWTIVSIHTNKQSGLNAETSLKDLTTTNKTIFLTKIKV